MMLASMLTGAGMLLARPAIPRDPEIEKKVEATLKKMNLDQKVGQMLELNLDVFGHTDWSTGTPKWTLDEARLDTVIQKWQPGSFLNAPGTYAGSLEQWQYWIPTIQKLSMKYIGIPTIYGLDNNHGVTYVQGGIMFPQPINLAASFNTELAREMAGITAYESRAADCPWVYNPVTDLGRDPRWPRIWESFGEDPLVNARMSVAQIEGYQGPNPNKVGKYNVAACTKHYMCYGAPWSGKDRTPAYLSEQQIREKYFEPFRAQIMAGSLSIMVNSASINGEPVHASYKYLTQWLKKDLDWDGMIVTDWADINNLFQRERVAKDKKDAIRLAINAGIDMTMDPYNVDFCFLLKELVNEGKVSMDRIDDAVRRILRLKYRLNLFKEPNTGGKDYKEFGSAENAEKALRSAEQTEILLKNVNNLLPLAKGKKILVTGPNANTMRALNGGWTYTWQGSNADALYEPYNTIYEALCNKYGKENVTLKEGVTYNERGQYWEENAPDYASAVAAAADVDVIVACIGENSYTETPGNLDDLWLSANQRQLVKELAKTGKPIILVLNEGRPRLITDIEPLAGAIVNVLLPGNYGGDALANLMAGDANFSAKMPYTYPREINALSNYDYKVSEEVGTMEGAYNYDAKVSLLWPFGYGLSYTTYGYSNLRVDRDRFTADDTITVSVDVTNTGKVAGMEPVLLYSSDLVASLVPDNKRLRDFTKISLNPGETKTVTFKLPGNSMAFVGNDGKWILEEGAFELKVANLSVPVTCTATKVWDTPNM
jgi:xylosidase/arabinosidase